MGRARIDIYMKWRIPFLDLRVSGREKQELLDAVSTLMDHGQFILGPEVTELETRVASFCHREFAVGVNSGTDALYLGLRSLDIGAGDEVIVPALSWIATANAVSMSGATPVFADIGDDLNIDPTAISSLIGDRTKAILCVHYGGRMCDVSAIRALAEEHKLYFLEDASQAFAAQRNGYLAGETSHVAMFSLNPMKVFNACGEAGILLTDDEDVFRRALQLRYNGMADKVHCVEPGLNARIDTLQAAILLQRLERLEEKLEKRAVLARHYRQGLGDLVQVPVSEPNERHVYYTFTILAEDRDQLLEYLHKKGIEAKLRDPVLMPEQPYYRGTAGGSFPIAKKLSAQALSLPMHEKLSLDDVLFVIDATRKFFQQKNAVCH